MAAVICVQNWGNEMMEPVGYSLALGQLAVDWSSSNRGVFGARFGWQQQTRRASFFSGQPTSRSAERRGFCSRPIAARCVFSFHFLHVLEPVHCFLENAGQRTGIRKRPEPVLQEFMERS
jgi:hypothetical protein